MYSKILIATDGSELADKALAHGLSLAKSLGSQVVIVTVTEIWSAWAMSYGDGINAGEAIAAYEEAEAKYAKEVLDAAGERARNAGLDFELRHVRDMRPSDGIISVARASGSDLIVMASHGRRGVNRVLLGSQTNEVVTRSEIPVLVVR